MLGHKLQVVENEKGLEIVLSSDMKSVEQCMYAANRANRALGIINRKIRNKEPAIMLKLYKALLTPHLEYCVSAWNPHYSKDTELRRECKGYLLRCLTVWATYHIRKGRKACSYGD